MRKLILLLVLLITGVLYAQDVQFVIYYTKGKVLRSGTSAALKRGDLLHEKETIVIPASAEVILICKNHQSIRLTAKGTYPVKGLIKQCEKKTTSFTSSYFRYVWEEFTHPHSSPETDPTHYMNNVGAVSRGCNEVATKFPVDTIIYSSGELPVYFITTIEDPYVSVYAEPEGGEVLLSKKLKGPFMLHSLAAFVKKPGLYYWQITPENGKGCEPNLLKVVSPKEYATAITKFFKGLPPAPAAETAYMKAFILEENHFVAEAFKYYRLAYKLSPSNKIYEAAQARFYE